MKRSAIARLTQVISQSITIEGWVQTVRAQKRMTFVIIRDVTGTVQAVVPSDQPVAETVRHLTNESVVRIQGRVKSEPQAPGGIEVAIDEMTILSRSEPELPIPVVEKSGEVESSRRLDWRWLDLRKPPRQLVFKVWTAMEHAFRQYCVSAGYLEIHSPKFMSTPSESGSELFEVQYFDRKAYLALSP